MCHKKTPQKSNEDLELLLCARGKVPVDDLCFNPCLTPTFRTLHLIQKELKRLNIRARKHFTVKWSFQINKYVGRLYNHWKLVDQGLLELWHFTMQNYIWQLSFEKILTARVESSPFGNGILSV